MGKVKGPWRRLTPEVRREVYRLRALGLTTGQIAEKVQRSTGAVAAVLVPMGGVFRPEMWASVPGRLTFENRLEIEFGLGRGESFAEIGRRVRRNRSSVCREVNANGGPGRYHPLRAHRRAWDRCRRPKRTKLAGNGELCDRVIEDLQLLWSPEQIARRLREDHPDRPEMWVSHETIYKSLYVQGRGELRRELARCLRSGRAQRRTQGRSDLRGRIPGMVMISERPAEVEDRAVPGHWEGDLIIGKNSKSAIGTLVERSTRFVILLHLPGDHGAETVRVAMTEAITRLPETLWRSITWDQGKEMSQHLKFTVETGIPIYFCDPHSPWQRGSNENTNGLLRQYFPKGVDLSRFDPAALQAAADSLNGRPRKTLGWKTPTEKLAELVAHTP
jgi:IS30 family transposase